MVKDRMSSFRDLRTLEGVEHPTVKVVCIARQFYKNNAEWGQHLKEAAMMRLGNQLRRMYVSILTYGMLVNPQQPWKKFRQSISNNCGHWLQVNGTKQPSEGLDL